MTVSGTAGATITGTGADEILIGGDDDDNLDGAGGNDFLVGGLGDDSLTGGAGNDTFSFGLGDADASTANLALSTTGGASIGGQSVSDEDAVEYDRENDQGSLFFDGSANSLGGDGEDTDALHVLDAGAGSFVFSTTGGGDVPGVGSFNDEDLVMWDGSSYSLYFDASANGLTNDIDGIHILDNGDIVFSTTSDVNLGGIDFADGDLIRWDGSSFTQFFSEGNFDDDEDLDAVHVFEVTPDTDTIVDFNSVEDRLHFSNVVDGPGDDIQNVDDMIDSIGNDGGGNVQVNFSNGSSIVFQGVPFTDQTSIAHLVDTNAQIVVDHA